MVNLFQATYEQSLKDWRINFPSRRGAIHRPLNNCLILWYCTNQINNLENSGPWRNGMIVAPQQSDRWFVSLLQIFVCLQWALRIFRHCRNFPTSSDFSDIVEIIRYQTVKFFSDLVGIFRYGRNFPMGSKFFNMEDAFHSHQCRKPLPSYI